MRFEFLLVIVGIAMILNLVVCVEFEGSPVIIRVHRINR